MRGPGDDEPIADVHKGVDDRIAPESGGGIGMLGVTEAEIPFNIIVFFSG
jgi:hypothetical protein